MSNTFMITWEADDDYVCGSAPQHLEVFESEIDESYSEQDLKDLFWSLVQEDFSEKVRAVSEDEAAFLLWAKGVIENMKKRGSRMKRQQAQEALARAKAATEGPWHEHRTSKTTGHKYECSTFPFEIPDGLLTTDQRFISHARTDLPAALDMLTEAMKSLEHLKRGCANRPCIQCGAAEALLSEWEGRDG